MASSFRTWVIPTSAEPGVALYLKAFGLCVFLFVLLLLSLHKLHVSLLLQETKVLHEVKVC